MNPRVPPYSGTSPTLDARPMPVAATPVGHAALIGELGLRVPLPRRLVAIGRRHRRIDRDGWTVLGPRYAPEPSLRGHLTFALKHEGVELAVLKRIFQHTEPRAIEKLVQATPTGAYARRVWFFHEWLTGDRLDLPDADRGSYVDAVDPARQLAAPGVLSRRHRVRDNLPGTPAFCPLAFRTPMLDAAGALELAARLRESVARQPAELMRRAAAFLLTNDSQASFAIEGERSPRNRIQGWGRAIGQAGQRPLSLEELERLQRLVIGDDRLTEMGLRRAGGWIGDRSRIGGTPVPDHISARPDDLPALINGLIAFDLRARAGLDPVVAAASLAFGFVYVHPFEDGNGRVHRYLIHHVLADREFSPLGMVFPVSSAILQRMSSYRAALESYSARLLPVVDWEPTTRGNVRVLNDTADFYRYFDVTPHAEFLHECIVATMEEDIPDEIDFLRRRARFEAGLSEIVDMPGGKADLLFRFLRQGGGRLSKRARTREFAALIDEEVEAIEDAYAEAVAGV